jgi:hypothetical protein
MFTMACMLAVMSTGIEMYFVCQYEGIRMFMIRHQKFGLWLSFFLSFGMGYVFGAEGLIAMFAAIMSTIMSLIIYESGALKYADQAERALVAAKIKAVALDVLGFIRFVYRVMSAPYHFWLYLQRKYRTAASEASRMYGGAKRHLRIPTRQV